MTPVQEKLRAAGVPSDAVRTVAHDLQQEWDFVNNRRVSRGYVARNTIDVRVDSIDRVGELLDIAVAGGRAVERVVRIEEHGVQSRPPVPFVAAREALQADAPPIAAGQIELRSQVTVTVELK